MAGVQNWVSALDQGTSRADVVTVFAFSAENLEGLQPAFEQGVFTPDLDASSVARLYYGMLDRAPDQGGLQALTGAVESGVSLQGVVQGVLNSPEYAAKFADLSDAAFIEALYDGALGRAPDAVGAQSWLAALTQGTSRAEVAVGITQSAEAQQHLLPQIEMGWHLV
ncbi:DUF4214 domain-containing protein [Methylobacterium soli]|uniref:DUF4214 domain-containing protein n=5 Tax=Methylobacterium soli TaxID=553447 RepID=A0A6L3SZG3_9HYPH|nr:DUF4214 domain-containing protein [Methylobacterium soli]